MARTNLNDPGLLAIILGLLLGPIYYMYCTHVSGSPAGAFELPAHHPQWMLSRGQHWVAPSGPATRPLSIALDPAMNPVRLHWRGTLTGPAADSGEARHYRAWLFDGARPVLQQDFSIARREGDVRASWMWVDLPPVEVAAAGPHDFLIEETGSASFSVGHMKLEVRRNVAVPSPIVLALGGFLIAAGVLVLLVPVLRRGRRAIQRDLAQRRPRLSRIAFVAAATLFLVMGLRHVLALAH